MKLKEQLKQAILEYNKEHGAGGKFVSSGGSGVAKSLSSVERIPSMEVVKTISFDVSKVKETIIKNKGVPKTYKGDLNSALNAGVQYAVDRNKTHYVDFVAKSSTSGSHVITTDKPKGTQYYEISPKGTIKEYKHTLREVPYNSPEAKAYRKQSKSL